MRKLRYVRSEGPVITQPGHCSTEMAGEQRTQMTIEVKIYAYLRYSLPDSDRLAHENRWDVPEGTTLGQVLRMLSLPEELHVLLLLNGSQCADEESVLTEGDLVYVYPVMTGG
jgi:molybdopterin converting factor small subunit